MTVRAFQLRRAVAALADASERGLDVDAVLERAAAAAAAAAGGSGAGAYLRDGADAGLRLAAGSGPERLDAHVPAGAERRGGALVVPVAAAGRTLGCIVVDRPRRTGRRARATLRLVAALAAQAVDAARLWEGAGADGGADELTGLRDHRGFDSALARELARARRTGEPLAVALLDLDRFGAVNSGRGRAEGDRVLRTAARLLLAGCRTYDAVARVGGDRFALLLPAADLRAAEALAARLAADVAAATGVTASAGVAGFPAHAAGAADLVDHAAAALAAAARVGGRTRVYDPARDVRRPAGPTAGAAAPAEARAVSDWAALVAAEAGLAPDRVDEIRLAAFDADADAATAGADPAEAPLEAHAIALARAFVALGGDRSPAGGGRALAELWRRSDRTDERPLRALERVLAARAGG